jgi:uncharacterized protein YqiB (DUF1249 family)
MSRLLNAHAANVTVAVARIVVRAYVVEATKETLVVEDEKAAMWSIPRLYYRLLHCARLCCGSYEGNVGR